MPSSSMPVSDAGYQKNEEFEEKRVRSLSLNYNVNYVDLRRKAIPQALIRLLDKKEIEQGVVIFDQDKNSLKIGATHPSAQEIQKILENIKKRYPNKKIILYLISSASLRHILASYPKKEKKQIQKINFSLKNIPKLSENPLKILKKLSSSENLLSIPIDQTLRTILACAAELEASDLHFEPTKDKLILRMRIDGIMKKTAELDIKTFKLFLNRIKILSNLKINIHNQAQDGNFTYLYNGIKIDVRTAVLPGETAENLSLRFLSEQLFNLLDIKKIGMRPKDQETIKSILQHPQGIIIISGPTGVGKNTSLHAFLNYIKTPEIKIITLEDPIEYHIEGISQIEIHEKKGLNFVQALRGALRQDPDIILLGEIRDSETAEIAFRASETGHLVLSTIHSVSAAASITRLEDLRIRRQIIAANVSLLMSQRLIRKLCSSCKQAYHPGPEETALIKQVLQENFPENKEITLFKAQGCSNCIQGYKGRTGVFELLEFQENIQEAIEKNKTVREIQKTAQEENKMLLMKQDAYLKALKGITTIKEIERIF